MSTPPGWHDDGQGALRWWDGAQWTARVRNPDGVAESKRTSKLAVEAVQASGTAISVDTTETFRSLRDASVGPTRAPRTKGFVFVCVGIGLAAGLMSGLFGVGGGTVIVPMLVMLLKFDQRRAAGTSLAAIVPTAAVGVISYALHGSVAWIPAGILAVGAVVGAQIGTWLLPRVSITALRVGFVAFLAVVIVMLFVVIPSRDAGLALNIVTILGLIALGLITGVIAGLLGVGGGVIVVPALMLLFGTSDLIAKGTSLLMMVPTAVSGTIGNFRRHNVDLVAAALLGGAACTTTALGAWIATLVNPLLGNILFAGFLTFIAVQMTIRVIRGRAR